MTTDDSAKHEQYVDALAGPEDYWLSITDAARATRRQDITIRRWIATGQLPVRRHAVGLNQRTRQVRASDLAKITPIIDPTAVVTGEEGRLNLMSIPVEQAQLKASQQHLQQQVATLGEHVEQQGYTFRQALTEHRLAFQHSQEQLRDALATQFSQVQEVLLRLRNVVETTHTEQQQRLDHVRTVFAEQLAHHNDTFQRYRQENTTVLAQQGQALEQALQTLEEWMTTEFEKLMSQLEALTTQLTTSVHELAHTQQRQEQQDQQIELLKENTAQLTEQLARYEQIQQQLLAFIEQSLTSRANEE